MKKRAKVHLLPTDKESVILKNTYCFSKAHGNPLRYGTIDHAVERGFEYQHLYITTDDSIKIGDWFINHVYPFYPSVVKDSQQLIRIKDLLKIHPNSIQKIIATNDLELNLPQIPQSFIEEYCKAGGIDEVDVEYEEALGASNFPLGIFDLKVTSNNEIIIHLIDQEKRDCLTIEQAESICFGFYKDLVIHLESGLSTELFHGKAVFNKHLEKALK